MPHRPDANEKLVATIGTDDWRGVARGLHSHLVQTGRRQKDLAAAAGMAVSNLSAYLNLHRMPSSATMRRILVAALQTQGVTAAMIHHWAHQMQGPESKLQESIVDLAEAGVEFTPTQKDRLFAAAASDPALGGTFLRLASEVQSLRAKNSQLSMAHTDAARESLVQSAVEAFQTDPQMKPYTREVEKDIRRIHTEERRRHRTPMEMLTSLLESEKVRVERAPATPRSGRGRWEGLRWLLSLKDQKRATISARVHPNQYPFELGRVVGHIRIIRLFDSDGQADIEGFARRWVDQNFPQAASDPVERNQLEQDIVWLIFRSLSGRWATGFFTLPIDRFIKLAEAHRYDVDRLAVELNTGWETVVNRISQLDSGLPVHFIKMDWRGVVLKRSSFSGLQFAPLYMRVCGRWASARSLITSPGMIFRQYSTFPDLRGETYFCIGRSVRAPSLHFGAAPLVYSLTLGVQARDAQHLIYAENFSTPEVECGVTCRLCAVLNCENRVCPSASQPGMGKFDPNVIWSGKTIHERMPGGE